MQISNNKIIRSISSFAHLDDKDIEEINKLVIEKYLAKGHIIFMEGDPGDALYFVKSGRVKIYKVTPDGREHIFAFLTKGDIFAEVTLFNDTNYPATAEVIEDGRICMIRNADLENLIRRNNDIALGIIRVFSKKLHSFQQKVKELALGDAYMRIAKNLIIFAQDHGREVDGYLEVELSISRQEMANMLGIARETVSRVLSQFSRENSIEIDGKKIVIKDMEKLKGWIR